jgi:hypothetical protein
MDAGGLGKLGRRSIAFAEGVIQSEAVAEVDPEELEGADGGVQQALIERRGAILRSRRP